MLTIKFVRDYGELVYELSKREVSDRYAGQTLGSVWALLHPAFLMCVYIVVFGLVFGLRFDKAMPLDYSAYLLAGLIPWLGAIDVLSKSCVVISSNTALVKQVVFPVEVLPIKNVISTMFSQLIFWVLYMVYVFIDTGNATLNWIMLLPLLVLQLFFLIGIAFIFSILGAIIRDIKDIVQLLSTIGLYLLPIIYLPEMVPDWMRTALDVNPLSHMIWVYQDVFFYGELQHPTSWFAWPLLCLATYGVGALLFSKIKHMLANFV
ncbi:ABC transporter permease [Spongorhabdus nitratireducens]